MQIEFAASLTFMLICLHSLAEIETHQMVIELLVETVSQWDR